MKLASFGPPVRWRKEMSLPHAEASRPDLPMEADRVFIPVIGKAYTRVRYIFNTHKLHLYTSSLIGQHYVAVVASVVLWHTSTFRDTF